MPSLGSSDDIVLLLGASVLGLLFLGGVIERRRHRRNLSALPFRISVNGSRGKSTVTRLLTGALAAGGFRPLGKTTGTEARLILGWDGTDEEIHRRPEGPNIGEQREMMRRAVAEGADTVVAECMAVQPEYQATFHRDLLDVNVLVITNALDDHLEEMGPTARDVAEVFAASIPQDGTVVVAPGPFLELFHDAATRRDAKLLVSDPDDVPEDVLQRFDHLVLEDHVAQALALTRYFGIDDDTALRGMYTAPADPYATRLLPVGDGHDASLFVNAFPANDPASTLAVWEHVRDLGHEDDELVVIMNCRDDRIARTHQFAVEVLPALPIDTLVITGRSTGPVVRAVHSGRIDAGRTHDLTGEDPEAVLQVLAGSLDGAVLLGVGNLHGGGTELVAAIETLADGQDPPQDHPQDHSQDHPRDHGEDRDQHRDHSQAQPDVGAG